MLRKSLDKNWLVLPQFSAEQQTWSAILNLTLP